MSPDDIDEVTVRWKLAASEPQLLHLAIAERLSGTLRFRNRRADWIIETVTCLSEVLEHPGTFASRAADLLSQRPYVTTDELANERDALLAALTDLCGPLDGAALRSWTLAIGLFAEFVAATGLHPFSHNDEEDETHAGRPTPPAGPPPQTDASASRLSAVARPTSPSHESR